MNILFSAFACEPGRGSEEGVGWNIPWAMSALHKVHVLTTPRHRSAIERYLAEHPNARLTFSYHDISPRVLRWIRHSLLWQIYYYVWQRKILRWSREQLAEFEPDVVHHISYVRYWMPSSLWRSGHAFVFGPIGGAEDTPNAFLKTYSFAARCKERLRRVARALGERDPWLRATYDHAAMAVGNTRETAERIRQLGARHVEIVGESALSPEDLAWLALPREDRGGPAMFLVSARLLHWKGIHLALRALAECSEREATLEIVGEGPERGRLEELVRDLKLESRVRFHGRVDRAQVFELLSRARALVHVSLHDSGGWVCLEAMAARLPVICLALGGPATQVTAETGFVIPAESPEQAVSATARAMAALAVDEELGHGLGAAGRARVLEHFTWKRKTEQFEAIYRAVLRERGEELSPREETWRACARSRTEPRCGR